ncbi:MAG: tetratricopeptide repeat protein [Bacteroidales bacterium]|nr:tetratricopeptide repeat protein [Bacteroidales bacterium]MCF8404580.1 tetratricopeptide repeat protein [Bacteroidales bacterium]
MSHIYKKIFTLSLPAIFFPVMLLLCALHAYSQDPKYKFGDYIQFGRVELEKENYTEAIRYLNNAVKQRPASYEGYFLRGIAKYHLDDLTGAELDFNESVKYDPYNSEIYHYRAIIEARQYNFGKALTDYTHAIKLNPKNPLFYLNRSRVRLYMQDYDSSIADLNRVVKLKYREAEVFVLRGMAWAGKEEYTNALNEFNRAIKKDPTHTNSYIQRGSIQMELNRPDSALPDFNTALSFNSDDSYALFHRALAYMELKDTLNAFNDLDKVIELSPENSYAYYNRAILKLGREKPEAALADLDKVVALNPDNIVVYLYRGRIKMSMGKYEKAIADFCKAIDIYPDFADAYYERSQAKKQMQDIRGAKEDYSMAYLINDFNFKKADSIKLAEEMYVKRLMAFSGEFSDTRTLSNKVQDKKIAIELRPVFFIVLNSRSIEGVYLYDTYTREGYSAKVVSLTNDEAKINKIATQAELLAKKSAEVDDKELLRKADLYANIEDYTTALYYYNLSIQSNPKLLQAWFGRANTRFLLSELLNEQYENSGWLDPDADINTPNDIITQQSGIILPEEVIEDYNAAIELDPGFPYAWFNRGNARAIMGDYWGAVRDYTRAIDLEPKLAEAHFNKGLLLIYLNLKGVGCNDISQAGELGMDDAYPIIKRYCTK